MNTPIGDKLFQDIPRRVAKFRENRQPQAAGPISAATGPKFTILWGHVEEILLLNKFFSDCRYVP